MKEFSKWTIEEVEEYFHLTQLGTNEWLVQWLGAEHNITPDEEAYLMELCQTLRKHVLDWNEEELKIKFIGSLMNAIDYDHPEYQVFFERRLTAKVENDRLTGVVDCVIAAGKRSPKHPYFCLHEYKPERHKVTDPLGQVAIAMIAAQILNNDGKPVYGAYVVGRQWFFLVLHEKAYALSLAYDATKEDDLRRIFRMLKYIKQIIEQELGDDHQHS